MKPLLICMTPVRNEAWVLEAFLKATSLWADYIIIADQGSTDRSRDIALGFEKVILIDNLNSEYNEGDRQKILIEKARSIKGDKIIFGLDADEILSANFIDTDDWKRIINSETGDIFWLKWANIYPTKKEYWSPDVYFPWVFHDDNLEPHKNYVSNIHSMRIPYPVSERAMYYVNDFRVLHLGYLNLKRSAAKARFYQIIDFELNKRNPITLSRTHNLSGIKDDLLPLPRNYLYDNSLYNFDIFSFINMNENIFWFDKYILDQFNENGVKNFVILNIWDKAFINKFNLKDPRSIIVKILHFYLNKTHNIKGNVLIRMIDFFLKKSLQIYWSGIWRKLQTRY